LEQAKEKQTNKQTKTKAILVTLVRRTKHAVTFPLIPFSLDDKYRHFCLRPLDPTPAT
jgi:hypothetical protein